MPWDGISIVELHGELEYSRIVSGCHRAKVVIDETGTVEPGNRAHVVELRVIPRVEALRAKLKTSSTVVEVEVLKQRQVPVVAAGARTALYGRFPNSPGAVGVKPDVLNQ